MSIGSESGKLADKYMKGQGRLEIYPTKSHFKKEMWKKKPGRKIGLFFSHFEF